MANPSTEVATRPKPKAPTLTQRFERLNETLEAVNNDRDRLEEALTNAVTMLRQEDIGWALPGDDGTYRGLRLFELHRWSAQIRASLTGTETKAPNPHMRNGLMLRHSFIWDGGIHYADVPGSKEKQPKQGQANVQNKLDDLQNKRLIFGPSARRRREHALYSDGLYIVVGDKQTKRLRPIPLHEITDVQRDELYEDEIIAYRWTRMEAKSNTVGAGRWSKIEYAQRTPVSYWVYVDWYEGSIPGWVVYNGVREKVLKNSTAFDLHANRPDGAAFGSPDAIAALVWARVIRDLIMNGVKMQDALAMFAFKVDSPAKQGAQAAALELGEQQDAGSVASMAGGNNMTSLNTAGKGYDFASIGFVVSTMAASLHVSGIALAANTALAGSSYGAAKTLDLPGQMAMETRRREHIEFDERILRWLGAPEATAYFNTYEDSTDEYRAVQSAMLAWTTGTLSPEGFREELEIIYGRKLSGKIPNGAINPNTETKADKEAAAAALVPLTTPADQGAFTKKAPPKRAPKAGKQAPSANQGKSSGAGSADHTIDQPTSAK